MIDEDRFLSRTFRILSGVLLAAAMLIRVFEATLPNFSHIMAIIAFHIVIFGSALSLIASKFAVLRKFTILFLCFTVGTVGAFPQLSPALLYLIPIVLSFYVLERKFIFKTTVLGSITFVISRLLFTYMDYVIMTNLFEESSLLHALFGALCSALAEVFLIIGSAYMFFTLILERSQRLESLLHEKQTATSEILHFCSTTASYHNKYLKWHIEGVKCISEIIIDGLIKKGVSISSEYKEKILFSVQFHDIGKIYIDSAILDKPSKLADFEFKLIAEHPKRGFDLFNLIPKTCINEDLMNVCRNVILQHHEKCDGSGYPFGLTESQISLEGKIVAIADIADALLSWRPYKNPMTFERMMSIFDENKAQFLPEAIEVLRESKDKLIEISDRHNSYLKEELNIQDEYLTRF